MTVAIAFELASTAILTLGLHSAVAAGLALLLARALRRPQDRDLLWKAALVAPILTAAVVSFIGGAERRLPVDVAQIARFSGVVQLPPRQIMVRVVQDGGGTSITRRVDDPVVTAVAVTIVAAAAVCVAVAFIRLAVRQRARSRLLASRSRAPQSLALANGRPVVLSTAHTLPSPVAIGLREVCMPVEVMTEFSNAHRQALVAHELAHLERRDPAWLFAAEIIGACLAFQPLVWLVVRAFRRDVELICDETAVHATGDRASLIGALAQLAAPFDARAPMRGAATAHDGSPLVARAERIASLTLASAPDRVRTIALVAAVALIAALFAMPAVSSEARVGKSPPPAGARMKVISRESIVFR
jgi:beta-lactamase regulating signal transducer with metallopeptidase domain